MVGFHLPSTGNISLQRGRPPTPVVDIRLVRPAFISPGDVSPIKRKQGERVTVKTIAFMRQERAKGRSLHEIASDCGVAHMTVHRHTKDLPEPEGGWKTGARETRFPLAKAQRMRRAGFTYEEIAEEFGSCKGAMWNLLNERTPENRKGGSGKTCRLMQIVTRASGIHQKLIRRDRLGGRTRTTLDVGRARHIMFWMLVRRQKMSLPKAGAAMRGFDHTSVLHGVRRVDRLIADLSLDPETPPEKLIPVLWKSDWKRKA